MSNSTDLLMGAKPGQMNLQAVKSRADEIRRTLDNLLQTLQFAPASLQWSDAMDKFAVLNIQLQHLSAQLRPLLMHYTAHPRSVNQTNAPILPIMLATKLLPEQETENNTLLASLNSNINDTSSLEAIEKEMAACSKATAQLAALVDSLTQNGGPLDPKGPARMQIAASVKLVDENTKRHAGIVLGSQQSQQSQQQHHSGELEGSQLLLAAASYGHSL